MSRGQPEASILIVALCSILDSIFRRREWTAFIHIDLGLLCEKRAGDCHTAMEIGAVKRNWMGCNA